jgi:hypothetical protein
MVFTEEQAIPPAVSVNAQQQLDEICLNKVLIVNRTFTHPILHGN